MVCIYDDMRDNVYEVKEREEKKTMKMNIPHAMFIQPYHFIIRKNDTKKKENFLFLDLLSIRKHLFIYILIER